MTIFRFGVFRLTIKPNADYENVGDVLAAIDEGDLESSYEADFLRELYDLKKEAKPTSWIGKFRKFRTSDLPHVGKPGGEEKELDLDEDAGLIERNFFMFIPSKEVLIWQPNRHASSPKQFATFLSEVTGVKVTYEPFLQPDAMKRIMGKDLIFKKIRLRVARPTNADYYPPSKWSQRVFDLLAGGGGDSLYLEVALDGRKAEKNQTQVDKRWRRALREFTKDELATTAEAIVIDEGVEHPIDLLADRIESPQEIDFPGRYPPSQMMVKALKDAWLDVRGQVNEIIGNEDEALDI